MSDIQLLLGAALLTWASLLLAAVLRSRSWTLHGLRLALGNRHAMPEPSLLAGRAERAAKNNVDNLVLFVAAWAAARLGGAAPGPVALGAHLFFWSRCAFTAVYLLGVPYLRTALFTIGVIGTAIVGVAALR
jgi:uncharacterized MAPEG superfamily protein